MKCVVLLSGGLDSAAALAVCLANGFDVKALTFDYGQPGQEVAAAALLSSHFRVPRVLMRLEPVLFGTSPAALGGEISETYVPARNTVFLAHGLAFAESIGAGQVVFGANKDDAERYPDCTEAFIQAMALVAALGTRSHPKVVAPFLGCTKADVARIAIQNGVPVEHTVTCAIGIGCGKCVGCLQRSEAIEQARK